MKSNANGKLYQRHLSGFPERLLLALAQHLHDGDDTVRLWRVHVKSTGVGVDFVILHARLWQRKTAARVAFNQVPCGHGCTFYTKQ